MLTYRAMSRPAIVEAVEPRRLLAAVGESEPNGTLATADPIAVGDVLAGQIDPADDADLFRFESGPDDITDFVLDRDTDAFATIILFDENGDSFAIASGDLFFGPLELRLSFPGTFYLGVTGGDDLSDPVDGDGRTQFPGDPGPYTLSVVDANPDSADDDQTLATASPIALGQTVSGEITPATDVDLYRFDADAGQRVSIDADDGDFFGQLTTRLRLFDANGVELASDGDDRGNLDPQTINGYIEYEFDAAGTYYVGVSSNGNETYDPLTGDGDTTNGLSNTGPYTLTLFDGDANDQLDEAADTFPGSTIDGDLSVGGDVDLYEFTAFDGDYFVEADFGDDTLVRLFDAAGIELAAGVGGLVSPLLFDGEPYFLGISAVDNADYDPTTGGGDAGAATGGYLGSLQFTADPGDGGAPQLVDAFYEADPDSDLVDDADGPAVFFDFDRDVEEPDDDDVIGLTLARLPGGTAVDPGELNFEILDGPLGDDTRLAVVFEDGPPPDGSYRFTLPAGAVVADDGDVPLDQPVSAEFSTLAGDLDSDGTVNSADLLTLLQNFGTANQGFGGGDVNYDGVVNSSDLLALLQNFGATTDDDDDDDPSVLS